MLSIGLARTVAAEILASALLALLLVAALSIPSRNAHAAGDSDGDGCPDFSENDTNPGHGGSRDDENPWDYMNPSGDGLNRADDILAVVHEFFLDDPAGQPDFHSKTDRTYVGPNPWNLGPPDGQQRVDDIIEAVKQFFHDCIGYGDEMTYANSWYISQGNGSGALDQMELRGYLDAAVSNSPNYLCTDSLVVLDFGRPYHDVGTYGAKNFASEYVSNGRIELLAGRYAKGWYNAAACTLLKLVIGNNNFDYGLIINGNSIVSGGGTVYNAGQAWAEVADHVQDYLEQQNYAGKIAAWSGSDFEQPGCSPCEEWDSAERSSVFLDGYNSVPNINYRLFLNYGTAKEVYDCLPPVPPPTDGGPCWERADIRSLSYRPLNFTYAVPEIYVSSNPQDWKDVRQTGDMTFVGAMTTCRDADPMSGTHCVATPTDGWYRPIGAREDFSGKLWTSNLPRALFQYSTNIRFQ